MGKTMTIIEELRQFYEDDPDALEQRAADRIESLQHLMVELLNMLDEYDQLAPGFKPSDWHKWLLRARSEVTPNAELTGRGPKETK